MQFSCKYLSEEREYKGYQSNKVVKAAIVEIEVRGEKEKRKLMRIVHLPSGERRCPDCSSLLSILGDETVSEVTYLEVADFHRRYRPLDTE